MNKHLVIFKEQDKQNEEFFFHSVERYYYQDSQKETTIYIFKVEENSIQYRFIENEYNTMKYNLGIVSEGEYYPNTKLVAKKFKIKYHECEGS